MSRVLWSGVVSVRGEQPWSRGLVLACVLVFAFALPSAAAGTPPATLQAPGAAHGAPNSPPGAAVSAAAPGHAPAPKSVYHIPRFHGHGPFSSPFSSSSEPTVHNHHGPVCEKANESGQCLKYYEGALYYRGGEVLKEPKLYLIFYGSNWNTNEENKKWKGALLNTLRGMTNEYAFDETYQDILHQYWDEQTAPKQISNTVTIGGEWTYEGAQAPQNLTEANVELEVNQAIETNHWARAKNAIFMVMEPIGSAWTEGFANEVECGYHYVDRWNDVYGLIPNDNDGHFNPGCVVNSIQRSETETATHEYMEAVTDPHPREGETSGWTNNQGYEIADICDAEPEMLNETLSIWVSSVWGNAEKTCVIHDPPEPPPAPPTATTEPATNVQHNQATIKGTIDPNGPDTHYKFEYGTTTAYGTPTPEVDAGSGTTPVGVSATVTALSQNTTYHYRVVAWSWAGTTYGGDGTFTTPYAPPEVRIGGATLIGPTVATIHGEAQQLEFGNPRTSFFEYGPTTSYGQRTLEIKESAYTGWTVIESALAGLTPNTLYHYRFVAYNNGGYAYSADATLKTTPSPNAVTEPPTEVRATSASLNAKLNPGGHSTTYQFEYWPTAKSSETKLLPTTPATAGSGTKNEVVLQNLAGLTPYAHYSYRIVASNSVGTTRGEPVTFIAAAPFTSEPTPANPEGIVSSKLDSMSCLNAVTCIAVGDASNSEAGNHQLYSEYWTGGEWVREAIPVKTGATQSYVGPVSCLEANRCIMLGNFETASGGPPAQAGWNGSAWSSGPMVILGEAPDVAFSGLNCVPGSNECFAVGSYYPPAAKVQTQFAAQLSGLDITWNVMSLPHVGNESTLRAISCSAANACTAVGHETLQGGAKAAIAERWNGTEWKLQTLPVANGAELRSVSCPTSTWCMAVGQYEGKSLAERWNGTEWTATSEPPPVAGREGLGGPTGVSCSSSSSCVAVGGGTQADIWTGSEWTTLSIEDNSGEYLVISCAGGNCTAVGNAYPGGHETAAAAGVGAPVAETTGATGVNNGSATLNARVNPYGNETTYQFEYGPTTSYGTKVPGTPGKLGAKYHEEAVAYALSGLKEGTYHYRIVASSNAGTTYGADRTILPHNWALDATPKEGVGWMFRKVACTSTTSCIGVGIQATTSFPQAPLAEIWNGTEWKEQATPMPTGAKRGWLFGVACTSATACEAVGRYENSAGAWAGLAMGWNGASWTDQTVQPAPRGAAVELFGVTCTSATACVLVGDYNVTGGLDTLAERWNGTEWTIQTTPNGSVGYNVLKDVSCTSASACTAVGTVSTEPLAVRWNGTEWSRQGTVTSGEPYEEFASVSCASTSFCEATGWGGKNLIEGPYHPIAEQWNGSQWTRQTTGGEGKLGAVSCSSASSCTAVGTGMIEGWNGSEWSAQNPVMPAGQTFLSLEGIACPTASACFASGFAEHGRFTEIGVIESFGPPSVVIEAASGIGSTSATVSSSVNPDGESTSYRFQYGTSTSYGSSAPVPDGKVASEQAAEKVSQALTGLAKATTYHYRVVATNPAGVTDGPDQTFKTTS